MKRNYYLSLVATLAVMLSGCVMMHTTCQILTQVQN